MAEANRSCTGRRRWFAVDADGLRETVRLARARGGKAAELSVEDDSPLGFTNLDSSFTLFAPSERRGEPLARGRFGIGEKIALALFDSAEIATAGWTVRFDARGRHVLRRERACGTRVSGTLRLSDDEIKDLIAAARRVLVPDGVRLTVNDEVVPYREPLKTIELTLPTELWDENGGLRRTRRIWFTLIPALLEARELEGARRGLDALEDLAEGGEGVSAVMQFPETPAQYDPAWTETEVLWVEVRLVRRLGDDEAAGRYLRLLFYRVRDADAELAREILELGRTWRLAPDLLAQFEAALPAASEEPAFADGDARLRAGESVRVVFVGGNETQAQYDERIRASLSRQYPGLTVTFRHTGWTSNWGQQLPGLVKECNAADAVVLMTMMRTMLGQSLRASLRRPWVSCAARGEKGIERSILKAASIALRKRAAAD